MCIAIIVTKDNAIIANIALEYFTIVNVAQHHQTHVLHVHEIIVKSRLFSKVSILFVDACLLCPLNPTVLHCDMLQYFAIYCICDITY